MTIRQSNRKCLTIASNNTAVGRLCSRILSEAAENQYSEDHLFAIHLALEEALMNAAKHGNEMDPNKEVAVEYTITPEKLEISIADQGRGFDPGTLPDPRSEENLYKYGGRGVLLMRSYMDVVEFNEKGNCVYMVKYRAKKT
ncbi:MAG: ATP-binding protein [Sedimentisphaerales bacterium]|nr:ATP-binding protein [Sedimentisphaerales bacterium]